MDRKLDRVLDTFVFVPIGLAVSAREVLPELAERGRQRVQSARIVGEFAVQEGLKLFGRARQDAQGRIQQLVPDLPEPARPTSGPGADTLAIPGYDSLSASQVLPRLDGLAPDELEAVRAYETEHRGRKTILGRIAQLQ